ncbi:MAG: hypothetical protein H7338_19630 [Candidatus Sericytochromatia bacterium]|nr:hypothetical protein [Candidatus Sericytochromatia bacterium]
MTESVLYIKKGCSTCVDVLKWLKANHVPVTVRDLFTDPLSKVELTALLGNHAPGDLLSTRSPRYKALGLDQRTLSADEILSLMAGDPYLVRRPTLAIGDQLIIGCDKAAYSAISV